MSDFFRASLLENEAAQLKLRYIKSCKRCNGKGRIATQYYDKKTLSFKTFPCFCRRRYINVLDMMIAGVEEQTALEVLYRKVYECSVIEIDIADGKEYDSTKLYHDHLLKYKNNLKKAVKRGYSYIFIGANGTGKTFAALRMLHLFLRMGYSGHFIKFRQLMKLINKTIVGSKNERIEAEKTFNEIRKVHLLIIDELGREGGSKEHVSNEIDELLKDRDMGRLPTVVITNRDFEDIEDLYEGSKSNIKSAFMRNYKLLLFDPDNDFRKKHRREKWFD